VFLTWRTKESIGYISISAGAATSPQEGAKARSPLNGEFIHMPDRSWRPACCSCIVCSAMRLSAQHHGHHTHHGTRPCPRRLE